MNNISLIALRVYVVSFSYHCLVICCSCCTFCCSVTALCYPLIVYRPFLFCNHNCYVLVVWETYLFHCSCFFFFFLPHLENHLIQKTLSESTMCWLNVWVTVATSMTVEFEEQKWPLLMTTLKLSFSWQVWWGHTVAQCHTKQNDVHFMQLDALCFTIPQRKKVFSFIWQL